MSPRTSEAQKEARRNQIIEAACQCFSENGFHGTTMKDICCSSELSTGAVYSYFKSKDELITAIGELGRKKTSGKLESMRPEGPAPRQLAEMARQAVDFLGSEEGMENTRLSIRMWAEGLHTPQIQRLLALGLASGVEQFENLAREGQENGQLNPDLDPGSIGKVWYALYMGLSVQGTVDPALDLASCSEVITSLFKGTFTAQGNNKE